MARPTAMSSMCRSCRTSYLKQTSRFASFDANTAPPARRSARDRWGVTYSDPSSPSADAGPKPQDRILDALRTPQKNRASSLNGFGRALSQELTEQAQRNAIEAQQAVKVAGNEPYHLNVWAHKHNMHLTFTEPSRETIMAMSAGHIGLRKAQRSTYDASYQLAAYFFRKMAEKQWRSGGKKMTSNPTQTLASIQRPTAMAGGVGIEVILRGYGPGREAFQKALLGTEGRQIKPLISRVTDATRIKFGGTRSHKVRRLG